MLECEEYVVFLWEVIFTSRDMFLTDQVLEMVNVMLEDLTHRCFLSRDMNGVKACIDTIMQCTLDFRAHLSTASQEGDSNSSNLINDNLFVKAWFLIFLMLLCLDLNSTLLSRNVESA
jgi:hypothetical protein